MTSADRKNRRSASTLAHRPPLDLSLEAPESATLDKTLDEIDRALKIELGSPDLYFNRELSWLQFNARVLEEALDENHPLLERLLFLSIFGSNLDEFFMIRISGLRRQLEVGVVDTPADGMSPREQVEAIQDTLAPMLQDSFRCLDGDLIPSLEEAGIRLVHHRDLSGAEREELRDLFRADIFPILTPLAFDPGHPFPHISNLSLNLAVVMHDEERGERFARLKVPRGVPRFIRVPDQEESAGSLGRYVMLEELLTANLDILFPGIEVLAAYPFRVTRDADFEIEIDEASDLLTVVAEGVERRQFGKVVRLQVQESMPDRVLRILEQNLMIQPYQVYRHDGMLGVADLEQLASLNVPELRFKPFSSVTAVDFNQEEPFATVESGDLLLHHPYESFTSVVDFIRRAASDPHVLAIKQTLYRIGPNSPIVEALLEARENGKQVSVLVELKARFDEENNIVWARALEKAGVHVVYGLLELKTHCKMCLVVRRQPESGELMTFVHIGTGNYNPASARVYTDLGLFTADREIGADATDVFNALTGYSKKRDYRRLLVSPVSLRDSLLERIDREIECHRKTGEGLLAFKMNSLVDRESIDALYRASQAGVRVELLVRGICCLRPGVPGISENIRVISIVGRFLEHSRIFYFRNAGDEEIYIGSADLMPRNLNGRVEVLTPILDPKIRARVRDSLFLQLADNVAARVLESDGSYRRLSPETDDPDLDLRDPYGVLDSGDGPVEVIDSQGYFLANAGKP